MVNLRDSDLYKNMTLLQAVTIIEEFQNKIIGEIEYLTAWQYIADNEYWKILQGWYGRQMCSLIEDELISAPECLYEQYIN